MAIVVGIHELLSAEAESEDRLPERERRLISTTDFPDDLPDGRPRRGRLLAASSRLQKRLKHFVFRD